MLKLSRIIMLAFLLMFYFTTSTLATTQKHSFTIDPIFFELAVYNIDYEGSLSQKSTLHLGYNSFNYTNPDENSAIDGSIFVLGGRYYFKEAQHGGYLGFDARSNEITASGSDDYTDLFINGKVATHAFTLGY